MAAPFRIVGWLILLFSATSAAGDPGGTPPHAEPFPCATHCGDLPCTLLDFLGFSKDNRLAAYFRRTCPGPLDPKPFRETWHVVQLSTGKGRLSPRQHRVSGGLPNLLREHGFTHHRIPGAPLEQDGRWLFRDEYGRTYDVGIVTREKVTWTLRVFRAEELVLQDERSFDEIYFDLRPELFLSADGKRLAVFLTLDAMILRDAGMAFYAL
jgi:hypothetical protein